MDVAHCYLDGNADAVEFCPHEAFGNILAASTYTLQEGQGDDQQQLQSRSGSISIFDVDADNHRLELLERVQTSGVFDIKWNPIGNGISPMLAQADADGHLKIYSLLNEANAAGPSLTDRNSIQVSSSMCLYLDWNPSATCIAVGLSDGSVSIVSLSASELSVQQEWKAHEFELWTTCFDLHMPYLLYSGSDDCKFSGWDLRTNPSKHAFQNSKAHRMGVCCIVKNPNNPYALLTGSYDETLRVWDVRSIAKPVNEASICLGGGAWRSKYHPSVPDLVLAACMHNGFAVVKINDVNAEVIETYNKHGSLAYGVDWQRGKSDRNNVGRNYLVASCSFYDRLLRVWIPESASSLC